MKNISELKFKSTLLFKPFYSLFIAMSLCMFISACNGGSGSSGTNVPQSVAIDTTSYPPKSLIIVSVGGGSGIKVRFDTGSSFLVIESQAVGSNVVFTNESITLSYAQPNQNVTGILAYSQVMYGNNPLLLTTNNVPIVVVPKGTFSATTPSYGIMGEAQNNQVAARQYLPYPYNQSFIVSKYNKNITFGVFKTTVTDAFNIVNVPELPESQCVGNNFVAQGSGVTCYNDRAVPVIFNFGIESSILEDCRFDTGSTNTFIAGNLPTGYFTESGSTCIQGPGLISAVLQPGNEPLPITESCVEYIPAAGKCNMGVQVFATYDLYSNQARGQIGISKAPF